MRLREHVDPVIGMKFNPSHPMWMGGDPIAAVDINGLVEIYRMDDRQARPERRGARPRP